jgi:SAM-dependent methyltransferase
MVDARNCDICGSTASELVYAQRFASFDDFSALSGYDVVTCRGCGFAYANRLPDLTTLERYYRELSKYEQHETGGRVAPWAEIRDRAIVEEISAILPDRSARILDVGCATGHLLATFRDAGFEDVTGLDPSQRCVELARDLYGIRVLNMPISQMHASPERFDLILVSAVLEHLRDLTVNVRALTSMLAEGGSIWFEVPDAGRFSSFVNSPFHQFSLEHINFFTARSLTALLRTAGLEPIAVWEAIRTVRSFDEPGLNAIFSKVATKSSPIPAPERQHDLPAYVGACEAIEQRILANVAPLAEQHVPIVLWGTGSLTLHLLTQAPFSDLNVTAFVDSNVNYHGKHIGGVPVIAPAQMRDRAEPILVVSHASAREIATDIRERHGLGNPILEPFGLVGTNEYK